MRRQYAPIAPVWFRPFRGWPFEPWTDEINAEELAELGASGWGCILVHREVVMAVREHLKGEAEIIEDDMDIHPYDLGAVMTAVNGLTELVSEKPPAKTLRAALSVHAATLAKEIRPLRGLKSNVGSDLRFPFFANLAGYKLWGDPTVQCGHMLNYPLSPTDYAALPDEARKEVAEASAQDIAKERARVEERIEELYNG